MIPTPSTRDEIPFFVRAGADDVFGVITEPTGPANGIAAIVLTGGAFVGATNRNRVSVRIARDLAERGFHAVRMDYHGVGDSTGDFDTYFLERPFVGDIVPAVRLMEERGIRRFVLVGTTCFGARTALSAAGQIDQLHGVALLASPVRDFPGSSNPDTTSLRHYVRRALTKSAVLTVRNDPAKREEWAAVVRWKARSAGMWLCPWMPAPPRDGMSPAYYKPLAALAARGIPVLLGYGTEDEFYGHFLAASAMPRLHGLLNAPGSTLEVRTVPGSIHALRRIVAQDQMVDMTLGWLDELA